MTTTTLHRLGAALAAAAAALGLALLPAAPAHAATTYTFTGAFDSVTADHHTWGDAENWSPNGVPGNGDSVVVQDVPGHTVHVDDVPDVTLASLTVSGADDTRLGAGGETLTVTGSFAWSGGQLRPDLVLAPGASGTVASGPAKQLWGNLVVGGTLTLDNTGDRAVQIEEHHQVQVQPGGRLVSTGSSGLTYDACCAAPDKVVNHGTIDVTSGQLTLEKIELDQLARLHVAGGAVLHGSGLARLGGGATYDGPGTLLIDGTDRPSPDPAHPDAVQGGVLVSGTNTLTNGFRLVAGADSELTGVGTLDGAGSVVLQSAAVYAALALGPGVDLDVAPGPASSLGVWDDDLAGYHAQLTLNGHNVVEAGARLTIDARTSLTVGAAGSLTVPGGATIDSGTCCSDAPELIGAAGSSLTLGGGGGLADLRWVTVAQAGSTSVPAGGSVRFTKTTYVQRDGSLSLGARSTLAADTDVELAGGTLGGTGRLAANLVNTHGVVAPGTGRHPGTLTLDGYVQGKHGELRLRTTKRKASKLVVSGSARLRGTLKVTGPRPRPGRKATVVHAAHLSGRFTHAKAGRWHPVYTHKIVKLVARRPAPHR
jgi:hypothetical protein